MKHLLLLFACFFTSAVYAYYDPAVNAKNGGKFDYKMANIESFLLGFHATQWVPGTFVCTQKIKTTAQHTNYSIHMQYDPNHVWFEKTFNWTDTISNSYAGTFKECATDILLMYKQF
jgi:hypothetical protein